MNPDIQPDPKTTFSHAHMSEIVNQALGQGFTGLARISYLLGQEIKLLIQNGEAREILLTDKNQKTHLPGGDFQSVCEPSRMGHMSMLKVPGRFLLLERACFDSRAGETHKAIQNGELEKIFLSLEKHESATVVSVNWPHAQAYVLVPGSNIPMRRAVFVCSEQVEADDTALSMMAYWEEPRCDVVLYRGSLETDAWIALHLNILFEYFCSNLLNQYGYLTGRVMVNSLARNLIYAAPQFGCELTNTLTHVQDQTLFRSLAHTVTAYKGLLEYVDAQMESVIGSNFTEVVKKQSLEPLNSFYANLARYYGFIL